MSDPHAEQLEYLRRIEDMAKQTNDKVIQIETYQKTHWNKLEDHENRLRKNEGMLAKVATFFSIITVIGTAWVGEFFKRG